MTEEKEKQLLETLGKLCNEKLDTSEAERLAEVLRTDAEARRFYTDYLDIHATLVSRAQRGLKDPLSSPPSPAIQPRGVSRWAISSAAIALASAAAVLVAFLAPDNPPADEIANRNTESQRAEGSLASQDDPPRTGQLASKPLYVAQMTDLTEDVTWGDKASSQEFLLRVRRGDRIVVSSGLVQMDYFSGAQIILHGPCAFVPTGDSSGRLESGKLTGQVSEGDFVLTTPTAKVIDLGTEFGVAVDDASQTEVCVFDGEVRVFGGLRGDEEDASLLLSEGMAARVIDGGRITAAQDVDQNRFARSLPQNGHGEDAREISLVDLLSGSSGGKRRLAGVIAPDTGEADSHPWLRVDGPGYSVASGYRSTSWHPYVDGVFIPSENGEGTLLTSEGHRAELPVSTGRTWGPIWSRRRLPIDAPQVSQEDYWGTDTLEGVITRLSQCETGLIGIHSNVGVTFDLSTVRHHCGKTPEAFRGIVSNLAMSRFPEWSADKRLKADLRVYVDGELRSSRIAFGREDGEVEFRTALSPEDRYLTIVCTDSSAPEDEINSDAYDHVVLIDPVLELSHAASDTL